MALGSDETQGAGGRWTGWQGGETAVEIGASSNAQGQELVQVQVSVVVSLILFCLL